MQLTARKKRVAARNGILDKLYAKDVNDLIRERYTLADELAVLRQKDEKPEEWAAYNAFCEECKKKARENMEAV